MSWRGSQTNLKEYRVGSVKDYMRQFFAVCAVMVFFALGTVEVVEAKSRPLSVAGWIPYWAGEGGIADARAHLSKLSTIYPFVFTVKDNGTLKDQGNLGSDSWQNLFERARDKHVAIIPTITTGNGAQIEKIIGSADARTAHIANIIAMVQDGNYDGVDIDYENRTKNSIDDFSAFLTELKKGLGNKTLVCTIEPRTPPDSLWKVIPSPLPYSNDYTVIAKVCDVVQVMAYDQQRADMKLNSARVGLPYYPNADTAWVDKVVKNTLKSIPKEKLSLGIATYGRNVTLTVSPQWFQSYTLVGSINQEDAFSIASDTAAVASRNAAGEQALTYFPKDMPTKLAKAISAERVARGTPKGMKVALQALAYANRTGKTIQVRMASWSDADAASEKVALAQKYHLAGVALFKLDGKEDQRVWNLF